MPQQNVKGISRKIAERVSAQIAERPLGALKMLGSGRSRPDSALFTMPYDPFGNGSNIDSLTTFSMHFWPGGSGGQLIFPAFGFDSANLRTTAMPATFPVKLAVRSAGGTWIDLDEYRPNPTQGYFLVPLPYFSAGYLEVATFVDGAAGLSIPRVGTVRTATSETVFYGRIDTAASGCTTTNVILNGGAAQNNHYVGARVTVNGAVSNSYVTSWVGSTKTATVSPPLSAAPASGSSVRFVGDYRFSNPTASRNDGQGCYRPVGILGPDKSDRTSFCIFGTSIASGVGDMFAAGVVGGYGFAWRSIRNEVGQYPSNLLPAASIINVSRSSSLCSEFFASRAAPILELVGTCDVAVGDLGTNDIALGQADWQNAIYYAALCLGRSTRKKTIFLSTMGPRTSGSWNSIGTQLPHGSTATRIAVNTWMRSTLPTLLMQDGIRCIVFEGLTANAANVSGVLDIDGHYWLPGTTGDGLHPNEIGHSRAADAGAAALQAAGYLFASG